MHDPAAVRLCGGRRRHRELRTNRQHMRRSDHEFSHGIPPLGIAARIIAAALLGSLTTGCTGWPGLYGSVSHINQDNPFDQAVATFSEPDMAAVARRRLLKRFPVGSPATELRRYLQSIGASCESGPGIPLVCRYSQYDIWGHRGIIGDVRRVYSYHDVTARIWPGRGPIAKLTVCATHSSEVQLDPMLLSRRPKLRKSNFKPCI